MSLSLDPFRNRIADLCREYRVQRLDMFGSATGPGFDARHSDVDFLVEFLDARPEGALDRYFGLRQSLQDVLQRPVDLVMANAVRNPYFLQRAHQQRQNVYAA